MAATSANTRVMAAGAPVLRASDTFLISRCPFFIGLEPHPCVQVQWVQPDNSSRVESDFTLSDESVGLCIAPDAAVQGTVVIGFTQTSVLGI